MDVNFKKQVVFVINATSPIGIPAIANLSEKYGDRVEIKAGVPDPTSKEAKELKENYKNIQLVQAKIGDTKLTETLKGVATIYIVTPSTKNRVNLVIDTATCAKRAGVGHIVTLSVPTVSRPDTIFGGQFSQIENGVKSLCVPYTLLRLPLFMEDYFVFREQIMADSKMTNSIDPSKSHATVALDDVGKATAAIIVNCNKYTNQTLTIASDHTTYNAVTLGFTEKLERNVAFIKVSDDKAKQVFLKSPMYSEEWEVDGIIEVYRMIEAGDPEVTDISLATFQQITGEPQTSLSDWMDKYAKEFNNTDSKHICTFSSLYIL